MNTPTQLFSNPQIDPASLPAVEQLEMIPLEPDYKTVRYISGIIVAGIIVLIVWPIALLQPDLYPFGLIGAGLFTLLAIWIIIYQGLSFRYMGYALREKDITYKSGWLWKSMVTVPFNRVQHCDVRQGLIERQFDLAKLTIYTAGGQSTDLMIPGLSPSTAEHLKAYILQSTEHSIENE